MKKIKITFFIKYLPRIITLVVVGATILGILLQSYYKLETPLLRADFISTLVPGIAYFHKLGSPYLNYWEIRPPALQFITGLWGFLIGSSLHSFHLFYLFFLTGIMFLSWMILSKLFSFYEKVLIYAIFALIFFTNSVQTQFFPPEINGLFFSLLGLRFALKKNPSNKDFFWSSFFFIIAGQMKEVFAITGLSLLPHLVIKVFSSKQKLKTFVMNILGGIILAIATVLSYLLFTHSLLAYREVLQYKSEIFDPTNFSVLFTRLSPTFNYLTHRFLAIPYNVWFLMGGTLLIGFFWLKKNIIKITSKKDQQIIQFIFSHQLSQKIILGTVAFCYGIGALLGYLMQNRYNHIYDIAILFAFILLLGLMGKMFAYFLFDLFSFKKINKNIYLFSPVFTFLLIGLLLMPRKQIWSEDFYQLKAYNPQIHFSRWLNAESAADTKLETKIKNNISSSSCIDVQHGWNVGQQYYYANRRPCTRFFITNIIPAERIAEYQSQLVNNPPAALIYFTTLTDLNVENFEKNIFDFTKVINNCFIQDDEFPTLYWPAAEGMKFKECFRTGLPENATDSL